MEFLDTIKEYSPITTLLLFIISLLIIYFKKYFEKIGEIQAVSDNIKTLQRELKENTKIVEKIKHEYSKNLEDYKREIELLNHRLKLKGNDEYNIAKKMALNLLKVKYSFPYIKPVFTNGISDEDILKHFGIKEDAKEFTYYDMYYYRTHYLMKEVNNQMIELNLNSYESEIYWDEIDTSTIKKAISQYENFTKRLETYRYSSSRANEIRKLIDYDKSLKEDFDEEYKDHMNTIKESLTFLYKDSQDKLNFLNQIDTCLTMLKNKVKTISK